MIKKYSRDMEDDSMFISLQLASKIMLFSLKFLSLLKKRLHITSHKDYFNVL